MDEDGIRDGMSQAIHRYAKANNEYMKNYDKNIISSYLMHLDVNNLYGWAMIQKLLVNGFKWVEDLSQFKNDFIKNYDENSNKEYFPEVNLGYPKNLFNSHKDLLFLPERTKKNQKESKSFFAVQKTEKYVVHIRALKQALNHGLIIKRVHRVIQFNQKAWLKPYIDMNAKLRKEAKINLKRIF